MNNVVGNVFEKWFVASIETINILLTVMLLVANFTIQNNAKRMEND